MNWNGITVLVTGGASFIGSHLVDALLAKGAIVRVVDNLSSGKKENLELAAETKNFEFIEGDLLSPIVTKDAMKGIQYVFHLAADHGGRGYVDLHQVECSTNMILDGIVFKSAHEAGVNKVIFASSGCVYPNFLQSDPTKDVYLTEDLVKPPYDADNLYGWAKLMGELALQAYVKKGLKSAICRYFTVYGPRGHENHAVIAMIAKAFVQQEPFEVWGTGQQVRNWTFVSDIVEGTILAAEKVDDGIPINLGTMERIRVIDAVNSTLNHVGHKPEKIVLLPHMPTGPLNRVASNSRGCELLGWKPKVCFAEGLKTTIDWYVKNKKVEDVAAYLGHKLTEK